MDEKSLRSEFKRLSDEIGSKEKSLHGLFKDEKSLRFEANEIRVERNKLNDEVKALSQEARKLRELRDKLNQKVVNLKQERGEMIDEIKGLSKNIKLSKEKRNSLNEIAKGNDIIIYGVMQKELHRFSTMEMPLKKEISLYEKLLKLKERFDSVRAATELHGSVLSTYDDMRKMDDKVKAKSDKIRSAICEADEAHSKMMESYTKLDVIRDKSNESHQKLLDKYAEIDSIRDKITSLRGEINVLCDKLKPINDMLGKADEDIMKQKKAIKASEIREKLESGKRVSIYDFKIMLEGDK